MREKYIKNLYKYLPLIFIIMYFIGFFNTKLLSNNFEIINFGLINYLYIISFIIIISYYIGSNIIINVNLLNYNFEQNKHITIIFNIFFISSTILFIYIKYLLMIEGKGYILFSDEYSYLYDAITKIITISYALIALTGFNFSKSTKILIIIFFLAVLMLGMRIFIIPVILFYILRKKPILNYYKIIAIISLLIIILMYGGLRFSETNLDAENIFGEFIFPHLINNALDADLNSNLDSFIEDILNLSSVPILRDLYLGDGFVTNSDLIASYTPVGGIFFIPQIFFYFGAHGFLVLFILFFFLGQLSIQIIHKNSIILNSIFIGLCLALPRMGIIFSFKIGIIIFIYSIFIKFIASIKKIS